MPDRCTYIRDFNKRERERESSIETIWNSTLLAAPKSVGKLLQAIDFETLGYGDMDYVWLPHHYIIDSSCCKPLARRTLKCLASVTSVFLQITRNNVENKLGPGHNPKHRYRATVVYSAHLLTKRHRLCKAAIRPSPRPAHPALHQQEDGALPTRVEHHVRPCHCSSGQCSQQRV